MEQCYQTILVGVDGSAGAELALEKAIHVAKRNEAKLVIAHVIDTRSLHQVAMLDAAVYEALETQARLFLTDYEARARAAGLTEVAVLLEFGNPKTLLAQDLPKQTGADLMLLGATGLNALERLVLGSSSEYILRHIAIDLLIVREGNKVP